MNAKLGYLLYSKRYEAGFPKQTDLADFTCLGQSQISKAEKGLIPNDSTLMILAIALNIDYTELFTKAKPRSEEELAALQEQEQVDKNLTKIVAKIVNILLTSEDQDYASVFFDSIARSTGVRTSTEVQNRLEHYQNELKLENTTKDKYIFYSKREAARLFYTLSREYGITYRLKLLNVLEKMISTDVEVEKLSRNIIELTDKSQRFSIYGEVISYKDICSIIEHHLTARKVEQMFK